jgi:hypothetical protein
MDIPSTNHDFMDELYSIKVQLFNHEHLCIFVNENHPLKIHKWDCTDVHMWNLDELTPEKKHCEWTTFHGWNKIYLIFLGTLFHSKISWIFMDGLLFHQKGFDSTTFKKVDTKETWNLNSKPFNLLSICFKDVLEGTLNFERALLKLQKAIW